VQHDWHISGVGLVPQWWLRLCSRYSCCDSGNDVNLGERVQQQTGLSASTFGYCCSWTMYLVQRIIVDRTTFRSNLCRILGHPGGRQADCMTGQDDLWGMVPTPLDF
jgi:hypothetical protein